MSQKKTILVTGGAGYIGRCTAYVLAQNGYQPVLIDNFSTGRRAMVGELTCFDLDLTDRKSTLEAFRKSQDVVGVIHLAAKALVGESVEKPYEYLRNNFLSTLNVAEAAAMSGVCVLHSSSCAVYGVPEKLPILETTPRSPVSPYGAAKAMAEDVLAQFVRHKGLRALNLRYFNPAGSMGNGQYGELHEPETHLIPNVVGAFLGGKPIRVFGSDFPTPDGTCVRDYIHIEDLVGAHLVALEKLLAPGSLKVESLNIGSGKGVSVKEVLEAASSVLGGKVPHEMAPRRAGDPAELVADIAQAKAILGWEPKKSLNDMIRDHHQWVTGRAKKLL
ncbi:MAG: UDP-glucose 4-epimerase GalE [Bdellovibrionaceae bacterium]|nr:UDP-glucose 4-epimerase GalE [Bdellovibrionales bacterium]MCB9254743.1 UDP-glucose 4-epimerase GalE [Pseudobdellovibrionaceae bacterium]